jgi:muramoyltetrapeptide carboxypeptidase
MAEALPVRTKQPRLAPGDTIGIVAPASAFAPAVPPVLLPTFQRGIDALRHLGYQVRIAPHVLDAGSGTYVPAQQRAEDINGLIEDPAVKAIVGVLGGYGAAAVLPLLDWVALARGPKIIVGYSAVTALLVGITARACLVTFHGPMLLDGFSEFPAPLPYTRSCLERVLCRPEPAGRLHPPDGWTDAAPSNDQPRPMWTNPGWTWLRTGTASGPLVGGNLGALLSLAGTDYWPSFDGAILFLEEVKLRPSELHAIDEGLTHLQLLGVFGRLAGLVVGKIYGLSAEEQQQLDALLLLYTAPYGFPVLTRVDFGHTDPRLTLPLGSRASLDAGQDAFRLEEAAVT